MKSDQRSAERNREDIRDGETLASVAAVLQMIELLAASPRPLPLTAVARELGLSKARA